MDSVGQGKLADFFPEAIERKKREQHDKERVKEYLASLPGITLFNDLRKNGGHPVPKWGDGSSWRGHYLVECQRRGRKLLDELGWPSDDDAEYENIHTGSRRTLLDVAVGHQYGRGEEDLAVDEQVYSVIENWEPVEA